MSLKTVFLILLLCVAGVLISPDAFAAIYQYTDKDGIIYFADDLQSVPAQYRSAAKIVSGEAKEEERSAANQNQRPFKTETGKNEPMPAGTQAHSFPGTDAEASFSSRALISVVVVVSAIFALIILKILDADHKKPIVIARVVIVWGVSVFLLYAHAGDVINGFSSMWKGIENTQQQSEEKGKKTARAIKALDTLIERAENMSSSGAGGTGPEKKEEK